MVGDMDGDGSPGIVAARWDAPNMLLLNSRRFDKR